MRELERRYHDSEDGRGAAALTDQVFAASKILLRGLAEAGARDGDEALALALVEDDGALVFTGVLSALLRALASLFAEDRGLTVGRPSLRALFDELSRDADERPDAMARRFGAWPRALELLRGILDARAEPGPASPMVGPLRTRALELLEGAAGRRPPSISDRVVYLALARLLTRDGQRRSYRELDVEQLGGVFESLIGYRVVRSPAGQLEIRPGLERRRSGSHYTPRALSEPIVARTLEPALRGLGEAPSGEQLLSLKICDPAMGSGAFLLAACRALAGHVARAWAREGGAEGESARRAVATRRVAQRCLYGVDKNPLAVDLARLSLWLEARATQRPARYLARALRRGDSLVGLQLPQLLAVDWRPPSGDDEAGGEVGTRAAIEALLARARRAREQLLDKTCLSGRGGARGRSRAEAEAEAEALLERARLVADAVVGTFFAHSTRARRRVALDRLRVVVAGWLGAGDDAPAPAELAAARAEARAREPFHWPLEFPDVFLDSRSRGLDVIVGNPPFAGKNALLAVGGRVYLDWLKAAHPGSHGNADYAAHFLRRAATLLAGRGSFGFITTNTICQGDTRDTGLKPLVATGGVIYAATRTREWPGVAAVSVAVVHVAFGRAASWVTARWLDGARVSVINSRLRPKPERADPRRLRANAGRSFQGCILLGSGFIVSPAERERLIARDPHNAARLLPYIGGEEVNSSPTQSHRRYVIHFGELSLEEARRWPELLEWVEERVRPARRVQKDALGRRCWWRFLRPRKALYEALEGRERCLVNARVAKHLIFSFQPVTRVFSDQLYVYPISDYANFATLQSRVHEVWARLLSSSMRNAGIRYTPTDCFATFPFPETARSCPKERSLAQAGEALYRARAAYMIETGRGLTQTYNLLKDPARTEPRLQRLRALHEAMDRAVVAAYGWSEVQVPPWTEPSDAGERAARQRFEDEVTDRLFTLNDERFAAEQRDDVWGSE